MKRDTADLYATRAEEEEVKESAARRASCSRETSTYYVRTPRCFAHHGRVNKGDLHVGPQQNSRTFVSASGWTQQASAKQDPHSD